MDAGNTLGQECRSGPVTDESPKPKRKRRRRIIAGVLLFVAGWWYWPRADARFVGKWGIFTAAGAAPAQVIEFSRNGTGSLDGGILGTPINTRRTTFRWRFADGRLNLFRLRTNGAVDAWIIRVAEVITGRKLTGADESFELVEIDTHSLMHRKGDGLLGLNRIPE